MEVVDGVGKVRRKKLGPYLGERKCVKLAEALRGMSGPMGSREGQVTWASRPVSHRSLTDVVSAQRNFSAPASSSPYPRRHQYSPSVQTVDSGTTLTAARAHRIPRHVCLYYGRDFSASSRLTPIWPHLLAKLLDRHSTSQLAGRAPTGIDPHVRFVTPLTARRVMTCR
jgi:hypothetical protein